MGGFAGVAGSKIARFVLICLIFIMLRACALQVEGERGLGGLGQMPRRRRNDRRLRRRRSRPPTCPCAPTPVLTALHTGSTRPRTEHHPTRVALDVVPTLLTRRTPAPPLLWRYPVFILLRLRLRVRPTVIISTDKPRQTENSTRQEHQESTSWMLLAKNSPDVAVRFADVPARAVPRVNIFT